jgi:hypothetical protein
MIGRLAGRREALVARSAAQRLRLSGQFAPFGRKLATVDRVTAGLRSYPVLAGCAVGALALVGPGKLLHWTLRIAPLYALLAAL